MLCHDMQPFFNGHFSAGNINNQSSIQSSINVQSSKRQLSTVARTDEQRSEKENGAKKLLGGRVGIKTENEAKKHEGKSNIRDHQTNLFCAKEIHHDSRKHDELLRSEGSTAYLERFLLRYFRYTFCSYNSNIFMGKDSLTRNRYLFYFAFGSA
jgi:hypothetical protein